MSLKNERTIAEIYALDNDEMTFAKLLGFYCRYAVGPDIESVPDRSPEWIQAFNAGHEEADEIEASDWDSAFEQGKAQAKLNAVHQQAQAAS
ncbi:TPA: hypothetical protein ACKPIN_003506 [Pseudomonas aeruginosa]